MSQTPQDDEPTVLSRDEKESLRKKKINELSRKRYREMGYKAFAEKYVYPHREKINAYQREYQKRTRTKVTCNICNSEFFKSHTLYHSITKKHQKALLEFQKSQIVPKNDERLKEIISV